LKPVICGICVLGTCLAAANVAALWHAESGVAAGAARAAAIMADRPATRIENSWGQKAAAAYLDQRAGWWMGWQRAARDHETFCVSCHTAVPYAISRQMLRGPLGESAPSANERRILDNVTKRVRLWKEVAPFYSDKDRGVYKTIESRGTESVLNALILASNEANAAARHDSQGRELAVFSRVALKNMWDEQQTSGDKKGAWFWLRFKNEPWEADDSDYFGAALGAIAVGTAPGNYRELPEIQGNIKMLREYLNREYAAQTLEKRVFLLWASAKLPGLVEAERQKALIAEILAKQQADGGWSLTTLDAGWKRGDGTAQEMNSDGYATGLITFALMKAGMSRDNAQLKRGLDWLVANQSKDGGFWVGYSLNKNEEHHIAPETALFMRDAATAYAVLALSEAGQN
jgi:squalene-hopene/tetraprenyl-beta-curcumene cyclase